MGYGHRRWLALLWPLALVTVGTLVITYRPDSELVRLAGAPPRNALLYTVDVLLPFVDLGYGKWVANGWVLTVATLLVVLGSRPRSPQRSPAFFAAATDSSHIWHRQPSLYRSIQRRSSSHLSLVELSSH